MNLLSREPAENEGNLLLLRLPLEQMRYYIRTLREEASKVAGPVAPAIGILADALERNVDAADLFIDLVPDTPRRQAPQDCGGDYCADDPVLDHLKVTDERELARAFEPGGAHGAWDC